MPDHPQRPYPTAYTPGTTPFSLDVRFRPADGQPERQLPNDAVVTGTRGTWAVTVTNEGPDVAAGAVFCVLRFDCQFAFEFQTDRADRRDHAILDGSQSNAALRLLIARESVGLCTVVVDGGVFATGDAFTVLLGDTSGGGPGCEVFWSATIGELRLAVDLSGDGAFVGAGEPVVVRTVAHDAPRLLRLLGPSVVAPGEAFDLHVGLFDRNGNPCAGRQAPIEFNAAGGIEGLPQTAHLEQDGLAIVPGVRLTNTGVTRLYATCGDLQAQSNPILVQDNPSARIFWGDVHAHGWGDSTMHLMHLRSERLDPDKRHEQARRIGRFDFCCPASMSMDPDRRDETFDAYRDACARHDEPGRYVPFLAYEAHPAAGDRQVIFRDYTDEPAPPPMRDPIETVIEHYGSRDDVLLQVHIGGDPPHWDVYRPERELFLEVCSGFGAAEWLLQEALQLGYTPGVCGASDLHLGWMGGPRSVETFRGRFGQKYPLRQRDSAYGTGPLTMIQAPELTRQALWSAIETRHTGGTSGARMIIDLQVGDSPAGETLTVGADDTLQIQARVHACAPLARVDLIAGVHRLHSWDGNGALDWSAELSVPAAHVPGQWLYLRVAQTDDEWGWTSPVYLDRSDPSPDGSDLPAWNACAWEELPTDASAAPYLEEVNAYLQREEHPERFRDLRPAGIRQLAVGTCAVIVGRWGDEDLPLTIRWFYEFEIPKIRFDFGYRDYGAMPENQLGPQLMEKYS